MRQHLVYKIGGLIQNQTLLTQVLLNLSVTTNHGFSSLLGNRCAIARNCHKSRNKQES